MLVGIKREKWREEIEEREERKEGEKMITRIDLDEIKSDESTNKNRK